MRIIGYKYDAALHCVDCTRSALSGGDIEKQVNPWGGREESSDDEHGLPEMEDSEGNEVVPVFDIDEQPYPPVCDDCGVALDA